MVVLFHLHEGILPAVKAWLPPLVSATLLNGNLGVEIFFVLSGFVIVESLSRAERSWGFLGRFALRRSIRLDLPLWSMIAIEMVLIRASLLFFPSLGTAMPSTAQLLANITYSQHFLGYRDVIPVFWSLTFEVQFYLVTAVSLVIFSKTRVPRPVRDGCFALVFIYSLLIWLSLLDSPLYGLFIDRWYQFSLGILAWARVRNRVSPSLLLAVLGVTTGAALLSPAAGYRLLSTLTTVATCAVLVSVGAAGRMQTALSGPVIQYLGRISYSLYLIHLSIGWRFISLCRKLFGPEFGPAAGTAVFLGGIGVSVLAAAALYLLCESPAIRLAQHVRMRRAPSSTPAH